MQITDTMLGKCFDIASDKTNGTHVLIDIYYKIHKR